MCLAPRSLSLEVKIAGIIGRFNAVFSEFNFDDLQPQAQVAPSMMLNVFEAQLEELSIEVHSLSGNKVSFTLAEFLLMTVYHLDLEDLYFQIAQLQLRIYYLRCPQNEVFSLNLLKLYTTAINIIEKVNYIDLETKKFASFCPHRASQFP